MKRLLTLFAFLALSLPATASAECSLVRGAGANAAFESTARPTVAVKASPELATVAQGKMTVMLSTEREMMPSVPGTVWYCLSAPRTQWNRQKTVFVILCISIGIILELYVNPVLLDLLLPLLWKSGS